jgi:Uma2 family endonuclease
MMNVLNLNPLTTFLTRSQFIELCQANPDRPLERTAQGELVIMSPVGGESGKRESELNFEVSLWNRQSQLGYVFSSSTVFALPNGGDRSPDVAWVAKERWDALSAAERETFPPICPDFVIELRSRTDRLAPLQAKMQEYLASGLRLGWLINPQAQQVEIYQPGQPIQVVAIPCTLTGADVLSGFELSL